MSAKNTARKFWSLVSKGLESECWMWKGRRHRQGYGRFLLNSKYWLSHRLAYALSVGPFDQSLDVCHVCDNPPCVNPAHLRLGTHQENMADMVAKGRGVKGERVGKSKLSADKVLRMREKYAGGGYSSRTLALEYGVNRSVAYRIVSGKAWAHVGGPISSSACTQFAALNQVAQASQKEEVA